MNKKPYNYIRAWESFLGSYPYYINQQIELARQDEAPDNAIFKALGYWQTFDDIPFQNIKDTVSFMADGLSEVKSGRG
ncbi:unnamed protein product [marine sediment metagenome]|uniref:Uncharacterized protein n=1 Tax=marine sediment metagenome TaxID=412755 RepID=X1GET8_9ZZZZ